MLNSIGLKPAIQPKNPIRFGQEMNEQALTQLMNELVDKLPREANNYAIGSAVGFVDSPTNQRKGIVFIHVAEKDKAQFIETLLAAKLLTKNADNTYNYKNALVGFQVLGQFEAQDQ